jgi:Ca2+-binding EF-hand superfamily protein
VPISNFIKRKLAMAFYLFDRDKNGVLEEQDFVQLGAAVANLQGVPAESERYRKIVAAHRGWWDAYFKGGDADGDGKVTLEEYVANVDRWAGTTPEPIADATAGNALVFDTIDANGNGTLSADELSTYLQAYGLTDADARTAFAHLDRDQSGSISRAEFARNMAEYYLSESRGPSEWFYGGH